MIGTVRGAPARLVGEIALLPGDKSISHRALMLGAIADGVSRIRGLARSADVLSTAGCLRRLGVQISAEAAVELLDEVRVAGRGMGGLTPPAVALDCGNSGTTMRLLAGLLAPQGFESELTGDESLRRRPMDRVVTPLVQLGANASWPPLRVGGRSPLKGIVYEAPVPSAQVKSAILLAGLYADGATEVVESTTTRDHTERMLKAMGAKVQSEDRRARVSHADRLQPLDLDIPGDLSSASFWLVAAGLLPGSHVRIVDVGLNPTRTAFLELLRRAGFAIDVGADVRAGGEPVGWIEVASGGDVSPVEVDGQAAATMIDELPVLAVAATQLPGVSRISGARELRVKESDRIAAMAENLAAMGADITAGEDGWEIRGPSHLEGARVRSFGDHRIAMAMAVAGLLAAGETEIEGAECVAVSYPGFFDQLEALCRASGGKHRTH